MNKFALSLVAGLATIGATAAFADGPAPAPEPVVTEPVQPEPVMPVSDWTGPYAGVSLGQLDAEAGAADGTETVFGVHAGYDYDFGRLVTGAELEYTAANDLAVAGATLDNVTRLKLRGGYDFGSIMAYATAGAARLDSSIGTSTGPFAGLGLAYKVTEQFSVSGEYLQHEFTDIGNTTVDADAGQLSLRGSLRF